MNLSNIRPSARQDNSGFTLLELLVVLAIIVALFAILAPTVMSYRNKSNVRIAESWVKNLEKALQAYFVDHGAFPTTEQGLNALIYIPQNEGQTGTGMPMQPGTANPNDPNAGMGMGATPVGGAEAFGQGMGGMQPNMGMGTDPNMGGAGATPVGGNMNMNTPPGGITGMGGMGANPNMMGNGMQPGMGMGTDPNNMMGGQPGMMSGQTGMVGSGWTQPTYNPQLYVNARKRPDPYLTSDSVPLDPWGLPFRYEYTLVNGVNPKTGDRKPAVWSAGYDGIDFTEDDIRSWDPKVAAEQLALQQQQMQMGGGMQQGMGMGTDPNNMMGGGMQPGMGTDPNMMGGAQPGMMGGAQPGMMGGAQPGMMGGAQPGMMGGAQPGMMGGAQPGMMGGAQPGMMGGAQPGMMGGAQPGMGGAQPGMGGQPPL